MAFSTFAVSYNDTSIQFQNIHHSKVKSHNHYVVFLIPCSPSPTATVKVYFISIDLSFWKVHIN